MKSEQDTRNFLADFGTLFLDGRVPMVTKLLFLGGAGLYLLSPIDLVPDFLPPLGVVDDGGILLGALYAFVQYARQQLENRSFMSDEKNLNPHDDNVIYVPGSPSGGGCNQIALGCFALTGIIVLVILVGIIVSILSGVWTINSVLASIGDFFGQPTTATIMPSRTIVSSLQPLGQLVSISAEVAQADIGVSVHTGSLNLCGHSANHVARGVIEAGVDITQVEEDSVTYDEATNTYTLTLPAPGITSCRIEYIRQYERSGGGVTCGVDWDNIRLLAQHEAMNRFTADTLEGGILNRAQRETTLLMQSFVSALTGSNVRVIYAPATGETRLPPSCQPQVPRGWLFDDEFNSWVKVD